MDDIASDSDTKPAAIETNPNTKPKARKGPFHSKPRTDHKGPPDCTRDLVQNSSGDWVRRAGRIKQRYAKVRHDPIRKGDVIPNASSRVQEGQKLRWLNSDRTPAGYDMWCGGTSGFHQKYEGQFPRLVQWISRRDGKYVSEYMAPDKFQVIANDDHGPFTQEEYQKIRERRERERREREQQGQRATARKSKPLRRSKRIAAKKPRRSPRLQD